MVIEDVLVENVTAYADFPKQRGERTFDLIRLKPTINQYMKTKTPGSINRVTFRNISLTGEAKEGWYHVVAEGADTGHSVSNVTFENITWFGNLLNEESPQVRIGNFTDQIRFIRPKGEKNSPKGRRKGARRACRSGSTRKAPGLRAPQTGRNAYAGSRTRFMTSVGLSVAARCAIVPA
jgi:hypothetical protein